MVTKLKNFKRNTYAAFLIFIILSQYPDVQGLTLRYSEDLIDTTANVLHRHKNAGQLPEEIPITSDNSLTNLAEPDTTQEPLISTTIATEFEDSENTTPPDSTTTEPQQLQFLRIQGLEEFLEKIHNQHLNTLELIKNTFIKATTSLPVTTPSMPVITTPTNSPVTVPSYTVIKVIKFPCGPFLKCLMKKTDIPSTTTTPAPQTTTTTTTTRAPSTTTRIPGSTATRRNPTISTTRATAAAAISVTEAA